MKKATSPDLVRLLGRGKISRREFVTRATAMGATAATLPGLLASADAIAATPKKGGKLRLGMSGEESGNSLMASSPNCCANFPGNLQFAMRNTLVETDHQYAPEPSLAQEWSPGKDPSEWTFRLRNGVEFHNGKTLTSEDVKWTIAHQIGEDSTSPAKPIVNQVKEILTPDPTTVTFKLGGPNADFPALMGDYHLQVVPDGYKDDLGGEGTGPFVLESYEPGIKVNLKRFKNYWRQGYPHFDEVEQVAITDVSARTNALRTGEVDMIDEPDTKTVHLLAKAPSIQVIQTPSTQQYTMPMRTDTAPYDNNDIRLALKWSIPRTEILNKVQGGHGVIGNDVPISPLQRYHNPNLEQYEFDADKAAFHFKKAGSPDYEFQLYASDTGFPNAVDAALLIQESAKKAGLNINVNRSPNDGYWTDVWMQKEWCACYWAGRPTEDWMYSTTYQAGASWNDTFWAHPRFNELLVQARGELNDDLRRAQYYEMAQIIHDEGGLVLLMFTDLVMAATDKLKRPDRPLRGVFFMDGYQVVEQWWFDS